MSRSPRVLTSSEVERFIEQQQRDQMCLRKGLVKCEADKSQCPAMAKFSQHIHPRIETLRGQLKQSRVELDTENSSGTSLDDGVTTRTGKTVPKAEGP